MVRKYLENITGIATGSDMVMRHVPNISLQIAGFKGEGITDDRCWIKKSHFPLCLPFQPTFDSDFAVICIRNPLDVAPSFLYLMYVQTHNMKFREDLLKEPILPYWDQYLHLFAEAWHDWHTYWLDIAEKGDIPVYFFRFEDMLANKRFEMEKLMKFIVGIDGSITGTVLEAKIAEIC